MSCCCNYNNFNRCNRGQDTIVGPPGPMGPQGPRGYTGAQGAQGVTPTIYAGITTSQTVATNTIIPIATIANTTNSPFSVSNNAINVPAGQYLVSYGMNGYQTGDTVSTTLYVNGVAQTNEVLTETSSSTSPASASKTILLNLTSASTIALYNTTSASATFNTAYITVTQLAQNS